jgi:SAM-dependent methyltransferase
MSLQDLACLWSEVGKPINDSILLASGCGNGVALLECSQCGMRFHDPRLAGDGRFYEAINVGKDYYVDGRPEFGFALRLAECIRARTVLDVGCGSGVFLDQAAAHGLMTSGMELNKASAEVARIRGHRIYQDLLTSDFVKSSEARFDLITFFQVVEHLPDPQAVLRESAKLLSPNGRIVVSVPNFSGLGLLFPTEPHQWPPHHVTRWRREDLRRLGKNLGLETETLSGDRLYGGAITTFLNLEYKLRKAIVRPTGWITPFNARIAGWLFSKLGLKYLFVASGLSLYAVYRRRQGETS